jgi:hypothetical protein
MMQPHDAQTTLINAHLIFFAKWTSLALLPASLPVLEVTTGVIAYSNNVNDAPKQCQQCTIEAFNIQNLLVNLRYRLEQVQVGDPWFTT